MSEVEAKCLFSGPHLLGGGERYENYECPHEAGGDGLCIFHAEKTRPSDNSHETQFTKWRALIRRCDEEFAELVEQLLSDPSITQCDFRGFQLFSLELPKLISKPLDFADAQFYFISLDTVEFLKPVNFKSCKVHDMVDFSKSTFREEVDFSNAEFARSALFAGTTFESDAKFWLAQFKASVWFKEARFASAEFSMAEIGDKALFNESTFSNLANFGHTKFNGEVSFSQVHFKSASIFSAATFAGRADFRDCTFHFTDFHNASFTKQIDFSDAVFSGPTSFESANIQEEMRFINDDDQFGFHGVCNFRRLNISPGALVVFRNANLEKASFLHTDLTDFSFSDVNWYCHHHSRFWPRSDLARALWDQFHYDRPTATFFEAGIFYEALAENYRQLVLNYEQKRDFDTAEDFHVGEMEMRRKKKGAPFEKSLSRKLREWVNEYGLYRVSSAYGTSYLQAAMLLLALILLFSMAFLYSGFRPVTSNGEQARPVIEYNLFSDLRHHQTGTKQWLRDYSSAISLSLSIITFQKDRFYEPLEGWSRLWLYAAVIILTAQGALVLLAIRRRFRR